MVRVKRKKEKGSLIEEAGWPHAFSRFSQDIEDEKDKASTEESVYFIFYIEGNIYICTKKEGLVGKSDSFA